MENLFRVITDIVKRLCRIENKIKKGYAIGNISFSIDNNGHLIQTTN